ncbi:TOBE domain-containing protein [Pantanalinema sp. GBBB05]|uniref:TOBE domain-containing protein n=1 Tax=Pantanalinema sp. GBBB05 TaxID=2604139 RepID=UPI003D818BA4
MQTSEEERQLLEEICHMSQRPKTEVLREMLRGLKDSTPAQPEGTDSVPLTEGRTSKRSRPTQPTEPVTTQPEAQTRELHLKKPLKVSSRNIVAGKVKQVIKGSVNTEVTIEIVHRVELTSTITTTSAEDLGLEAGKTAYAVIKSSDVVEAME